MGEGNAGSRSGACFVVRSGPLDAASILIPPGTSTLGRSQESALRLDVEGTSRLHAEIDSSRAGTFLSDRHSTNGTWVNGRRISGPVRLGNGDMVQLGTVLLQFFESGSQQVHAPLPRRRKTLRSTLVIAGVAEIVGLSATAYIAFLTGWVGALGWLLAPVGAVLIALLKVLVEEVGTRSAAVPAGESRAVPAPGAGPVPPAGRRHGERSLALTAVVVILVLGFGGVAAAAGVRYLTGWITGNEPGVERLVAPISVTSGGVTLTVDGVLHTNHFTQVGVTVRNDGTATISLPLFVNCTLVKPDATWLEVDAFRSRWSIDVPSGQTRRGTLVFKGHVAENATLLSLSFATVFGGGFQGSLALDNIDLRALHEATAQRAW